MRDTIKVSQLITNLREVGLAILFGTKHKISETLEPLLAKLDLDIISVSLVSLSRR